MNASPLSQRLQHLSEKVSTASDLRLQGKVVRLIGLTLEGTGCHAAMGARCQVVNPNGQVMDAEVVGFNQDRLYLMSSESAMGLSLGAKIKPYTDVSAVDVGESMLGRIMDGQGESLDGKPRFVGTEQYPLISKTINPFERALIDQPLDVGIRAINSLLSIGRGQRIGLFAGSGVGKSVLLGMMTRYTQADVIVVGLIGERGREVKEFIERNLGPEGVARSVVIASPADTSPLMRLQGAARATAIAEYFRDRGANVLLLLDSLTRYAHAQRELGLAIGEPPATKGYPPSVFAKLSQLVERAGNGVAGSGSITAFYTVLAEGDDQQDPVADAARSFLDGHIVLSRTLAEQGHYPAIDIEASISRVAPSIMNSSQAQACAQFRRLYSKYQQNRDLLQVGAYQAGTDPLLDTAIQRLPELNAFLAQEQSEKVDYNESISMLTHLFE